VTEVPEHLLRRSKERRAALGLEGGVEAASGAGPPPATPAIAAASTEGGGVAVLEETGPPGADLEALGEGGVLEETGAEETLLTGGPPVAARTRVPIWIMPVLAAMPLWAFVYMGAFGNRARGGTSDPVARGNLVFHSAGCSGCHGTNGEGGVGPKLAGGGAVQTFPNIADHITWVHTGGAPFIGKTYGAAGHTVPPNNVMPAFGQDHGGSLSDEQIQDVVAYERQGL
jgi:mono/diheme cytochrome c family protein